MKNTAPASSAQFAQPATSKPRKQVPNTTSDPAPPRQPFSRRTPAARGARR